MSDWKEDKTRAFRCLVRQAGKMRLEARTTSFGAWVWEVMVDVEDRGWSRVVGGSARTLKVAQMSAQMAASALMDDAATMAGV